ncbi:hypothetical protein JW916_07435 [Candidatus Sumerlaeota bacterium]|nr:hypothetical protein [Candidatus Sumerlaeota bacterium]
MSRFLDQIRRAKDAQQRAAAEKAGDRAQEGERAASGESLVPEKNVAPPPSQPQPPPTPDQALYPGELEKRKRSEPSIPESPPRHAGRPSALFPERPSGASRGPEPPAPKPSAPPPTPELMPEILSGRREKESSEPVAPPPRLDLIPELSAGGKKPSKAVEEPSQEEQTGPLIPEAPGERRAEKPQPPKVSVTSRETSFLVPETLADEHPLPKPRPAPAAEPTVPPPAAGISQYVPPPRKPVPEVPKPPESRGQADVPPMQSRAAPAAPPPSPEPRPATPPQPTMRARPEPESPSALVERTPEAAPALQSSEPSRPPVVAAGGVPYEKRSVARAPRPQRARPPKGLFPKELEEHSFAEEEDDEDRQDEDSFPSEERIAAAPKPRAAAPAAGQRSESTSRRRARREIVVSGPEVDPEFVQRIAKIAPRPDTRIVSFYRPKHHVCEEYRLLGKNILHTFNGMSGASSRGRVVVLTSSVRNEGKTLTCVNLAMTLAQDLKDRVLLMDGDLRHPRIHTYIGSPAGTGLNDLLASSDPGSILEDCLLRTDTGLHLLLASASRGNPAPLLDSPQSTQLFNLLRERYALVIVDTPPVLLATDALTLGPRSDGMLFLIRARKTKREQIQEARQRIARLDIRMLGYVMNKVRTDLPRILRERFYYYGHY